MMKQCIFINPGDEDKLDQHIYEDRIERKTRYFARSQSDKIFADLTADQILATLSYLIGDLYLYMKPSQMLFKYMSNRLRAVIQQARVCKIMDKITRTVLSFLTMTLPSFIHTVVDNDDMTEHQARDYFAHEMFAISNDIQSEAIRISFDIEQILTGKISNNSVFIMLNKLYITNQAIQLKNIIKNIFAVPTRSTIIAYYFIPLYYKLIAQQYINECAFKDRKLWLQYKQHITLAKFIQQDFPEALSQPMIISVLEAIDSSTRDILHYFWETPIAQAATWSPTPFSRKIPHAETVVEDTISKNINYDGLNSLFAKISKDYKMMSSQNQNNKTQLQEQQIQSNLAQIQEQNDYQHDIKVTEPPESLSDTVIHNQPTQQTKIINNLFGTMTKPIIGIQNNNNADGFTLSLQSTQAIQPQPTTSNQLKPFEFPKNNSNQIIPSATSLNNVFSTNIQNISNDMKAASNTSQQLFSTQFSQKQQGTMQQISQPSIQLQPVQQPSKAQVNQREVISQINEYMGDMLREYGLVGIIQAIQSQKMANQLQNTAFKEENYNKDDNNKIVDNINQQIYQLEQFDANLAMVRVQNKINQLLSPHNAKKDQYQYNKLQDNIIQTIQEQFKF